MANPQIETGYMRIAMTRKPRRIINEGVGCGVAPEGTNVARAKAP